MAGVVILAVSASLNWGGGAAIAATRDGVEGQQKQQPSKSKRKSGTQSMSGCVDQQDGKYVLVDDRTLSPVADLTAESFPAEGFAKYVGRKVIVRGTSSPGERRPSFRVRSVEAVSDVCAPQTEHQ